MPYTSMWKASASFKRPLNAQCSPPWCLAHTSAWRPGSSCAANVTPAVLSDGQPPREALSDETRPDRRKEQPRSHVKFKRNGVPTLLAAGHGRVPSGGRLTQALRNEILI